MSMDAVNWTSISSFAWLCMSVHVHCCGFSEEKTEYSTELQEELEEYKNELQKLRSEVSIIVLGCSRRHMYN